jgi:tetratricopeptide (TPR) repeat protein
VRLFLLPAAALGLFLASASVGASQPATTGDETAADAVNSIFDQYFDRLYERHFDQALALTTKLHPDVDNKTGTAVVDGMRAAALIALKRDSEANQMIAEAERLAPQEPFPTTTILEGSLVADRFAFAADALDKLIARFPDVMRDQRPQLVGYFLRNEPKGQEQRNEDRRVALARIGYGGSSNGDWLASSAIDILLKRGDLAGAGDLLGYIDDPQMIENMLVQKRYSALWPEVEDRAGKHLSKVRASSVASAEQDYLKAPDDHEKLKLYLNALRHAGRLDDAVALRSRLPATRDTMAKADEDLGWSVNEVALALHESGRPDQADQLFAMLNEAPMDKAGWRVSMIINRLELLVADGKFDKAATLLDATELSAKNDGSDFARQLVRRLKYCTMSSLGRKDEAAKILPDVMAHAGDAAQPTIEGLLCAGEVDKAEQLVVKTFNDPKATPAKKRQFEEDFVRGLQPVPLTSDDPSVWSNRLAVLRQRPAIAAAYARLGRDMPADYLAQKSK